KDSKGKGRRKPPLLLWIRPLDNFFASQSLAVGTQSPCWEFFPRTFTSGGRKGRIPMSSQSRARDGAPAAFTAVFLALTLMTHPADAGPPFDGRWQVSVVTETR